MFFRKKIFKTSEQKEAEALPKTKKVQYVASQKLSELMPQLAESTEALLTLEPVNYYASKDEFLQCTFYYNEDYSSVFFTVELYQYDRAVLTTPFYRADRELMRNALRRFGQQI